MKNDLTQYQSFITDIKTIIAAGRDSTYRAANAAMLMTYWGIGKRMSNRNKTANIERNTENILFPAFR